MIERRAVRALAISESGLKVIVYRIACSGCSRARPIRPKHGHSVNRDLPNRDRAPACDITRVRSMSDIVCKKYVRYSM